MFKQASFCFASCLLSLVTVTLFATSLHIRPGSQDFSTSQFFEVGSPSRTSPIHSASRLSRGQSLEDGSSSNDASFDWTNPRRPDLSIAEEGDPVDNPKADFMLKLDAVHLEHKSSTEEEPSVSESSRCSSKHSTIVESPLHRQDKQPIVKSQKSTLSKLFGKICVGACLRIKQG